MRWSALRLAVSVHVAEMAQLTHRGTGHIHHESCLKEVVNSARHAGWQPALCPICRQNISQPGSWTILHGLERVDEPNVTTALFRSLEDQLQACRVDLEEKTLDNDAITGYMVMAERERDEARLKLKKAEAKLESKDQRLTDAHATISQLRDARDDTKYALELKLQQIATYNRNLDDAVKGLFETIGSGPAAIFRPPGLQFSGRSRQDKRPAYSTTGDVYDDRGDRLAGANDFAEDNSMATASPGFETALWGGFKRSAQGRNPLQTFDATLGSVAKSMARKATAVIKQAKAIFWRSKQFGRLCLTFRSSLLANCFGFT